MTASPICKSCFAVAAWNITRCHAHNRKCARLHTTGVVQVQTRTVLPQDAKTKVERVTRCAGLGCLSVAAMPPGQFSRKIVSSRDVVWAAVPVQQPGSRNMQLVSAAHTVGCRYDGKRQLSARVVVAAS